jgi:hypothetical protein
MIDRTRSVNEAMTVIARRIAERATTINLAPADEIGRMREMVTMSLDQIWPVSQASKPRVSSTG